MATRLRKAATRSSRARAALLPLAVGTVAAAVSGLALADSGVQRRCVALSSIDRTDIVDDGTILFRMRNGEIYRNVLSHECPTLKDRDQFTYRVNTAQLCSTDLITVLEQGAFGLVPGPSCSLGSFEHISSSAAQALLDAAPN